jgi:biopolymer transport protein ExbB/TolQ
MDGAIIPPSEQLTAGVGLPSAPPQDMSLTHMFLNADLVVQAVMLLLFLASVASWVVIIEKAQTLRRASREIMRFKQAASWRDGLIRAADFPELTEPIVKAGLEESGHPAEDETKSEYRERIERSMRAELSALMDRLGYRVMFLASVGAVSPFVGLFGTVWGIVHSFIGIAASGETTLAVVAPGIAEALFATAMGLVAAIPAVVAYNKITGTLKKITKEALAGIGRLGNRLARLNYKKVLGA